MWTPGHHSGSARVVAPNDKCAPVKIPSSRCILQGQRIKSHSVNKQPRSWLVWSSRKEKGKKKKHISSASAALISAESWYWAEHRGWLVPMLASFQLLVVLLHLLFFSQEQFPPSVSVAKPWWLAACINKPNTHGYLSLTETQLWVNLQLKLAAGPEKRCSLGQSLIDTHEKSLFAVLLTQDTKSDNGFTANWDTILSVGNVFLSVI